MTIELTVISDREQADGRRSIRFCFDWKTGCIEKEILVASAYSISDNTTVLISNIQNMLEQKEINKLPEKIKSGQTVKQILAGLEFITPAQAVTKALDFGASEPDINQIANMKTVYDYLLIIDLTHLTELSDQYIADSLERMRLAIQAAKTINEIERLRSND